MTIKLAKLLAMIDVPCQDERIVAGISDDSRQIEKDWLFLARKGTQDNGEQYVNEALAKGAVVLWEQKTCPNCYQCRDITAAQAVILRAFYHDPCRHLHVIGVTGTNGKTSISNLLAQMLAALGKKTMVIGTGHIRYEDHDIPIDNTTPSACTLAYYFHAAQETGCFGVIMEVSSHAIDQKRIGFIRFDEIIYTNIASDHLDYHITRTHYQYTKLKLRNYLKRTGIIIVNHDDSSLHPLYQFHDRKIVTIGQGQAHLQLSKCEVRATGSTFCLQQEAYTIPVLGFHNIVNTAQCLVVLQRLHVSLAQRQQITSRLHSVSGRMECHEWCDRYIVIDYAHTASSLQTLLHTVDEMKEKRMLVICGCGGDRDRTKRSKMAEIAVTYGDIVIFTSDNPRNEYPADILKDMTVQIKGDYEVFENRFYAIKYAVKIAQEHDIIVIAGKGDEVFQYMNDKKYPFSDRECVRQVLKDVKL